jgi:hypothetical protein
MSVNEQSRQRSQMPLPKLVHRRVIPMLIRQAGQIEMLAAAQCQVRRCAGHEQFPQCELRAVKIQREFVHANSERHQEVFLQDLARMNGY